MCEILGILCFLLFPLVPYAQWNLIHQDTDQEFYDLKMCNKGDSLLLGGIVANNTPGYIKINTNDLSERLQLTSSYPISIDRYSDTSSWILTNSGKLYFSDNDFDTYQQITSSNFSTSLTLADILFTSDSVGFISENDPVNNKMFRTLDKGTTWTQVGTQDNAGGYSFFVDNDSIFSVSQNGVFISNDNGLNWNWDYVQSQNEWYLSDIYKKGALIIIAAQGAATLQVPNYGAIIVSTDYGATWSYKSYPAMLIFDDVEMVSDSVGYAVGWGSNNNQQGVYKTIDRGESWHPQGYTSPISGFSRFYKIQCPHPDTCYACGTEGKIIRTYNGGGEFTDVGIHENTANPDVIVYPSPANQTLTIQSESNVLQYSIYDLRGVLITQRKPQRNTIDVSTLPVGLYLIKLKTEEGIIVKKFEKD